MNGFPNTWSDNLSADSFQHTAMNGLRAESSSSANKPDRFLAGIYKGLIEEFLDPASCARAASDADT